MSAAPEPGSMHAGVRLAMSVLVWLALVVAVHVALPATARGAGGGLSCSARMQGATLRLCGARTDNYKDCYNTPDELVETRTWLSMNQVRAFGAAYVVDADQSAFSVRLQLHRAYGHAGAPARVTMEARAITGSSIVASLVFRVDRSTGMWGPLVATTRRVAASEVVRLALTLRVRGAIRARTLVSYRRDAALAQAAPGTIEYNGPGGRFWVDGRRTSTDVELGSMAEC